MLDIPLGQGRLRFLQHKWGLTAEEKAQLFMEDHDYVTQDGVTQYRISNKVDSIGVSGKLTAHTRLLASELASQYVQLVRRLANRHQQENKPTPLTSISDQAIMPTITLYDGQAGAELLALMLAANHPKPLFHTINIEPGNVVLIFNPPSDLASQWDESVVEFYLQLLKGFWQTVYRLCRRYDISMRRLNYRGAHVENELYYALEFSDYPFANEP